MVVNYKLFKRSNGTVVFVIPWLGEIIVWDAYKQLWSLSGKIEIARRKCASRLHYALCKRDKSHYYIETQLFRRMSAIMTTDATVLQELNYSDCEAELSYGDSFILAARRICLMGLSHFASNWPTTALAMAGDNYHGHNSRPISDK